MTNQITGRLEPIQRTKDFLPWRRAESLDRCFLYWVPVNSFPVPARQRTWLLQFLDGLEANGAKQMGLRGEVFVQVKTLQPEETKKAFIETAPQFNPIIGLGRHPGKAIPPTVTMDDLQQFSKDISKFNVNDHVADYCYWFLEKAGTRQREIFFGNGGTTTLFLPQNAGKPAYPPLPAGFLKQPIAQQMGFSRMLNWANSLQDGFLNESKELFGKGLMQDSQYKALKYIVPLLATADFFRSPAEDVKKWFELFTIYVNESPEDKGIILASGRDLDEMMAKQVKEMVEAGSAYPER